MFNRSDIIENCIKTYEEIVNKNVFPIIGYSGVILNDSKDYWKSTHIHKPNEEKDVKVDIIKGRFMFMNKNILNKVLLENEPTCEDIKISSYSKYKILPSVIQNGLINLDEGLEALHGSLEQKDKRTDAVKKYF
jgi:hypothetical protein